MNDANKKNVINLAEKRQLKMKSNNIDYTSAPDDSFLYSSDKLSDHYLQLEAIKERCSQRGDLYDFQDFILGLVTLAYFRVNEKHLQLDLDIPAEVSTATLKHSYDYYNHIDMTIFEYYKIICRSNNVLERTIRIFEQHVNDLPNNYNNHKPDLEYVKRIICLNWSDKDFNKVIYEKTGVNSDHNCKKRVFSCTDQLIGLYLQTELMEDVLYVSDYTEKDQPNLQSTWDGLYRLINPSPQEKQLCLSTQFMEYVFNFLEKTGWPQRNRWQAVRSALANVQTIQNNELLWAMHTTGLVLCGCKEALTGEIEIEQTLDKITDRDFDVISLPGVSKISNKEISDYGPIDLGSEKVDPCNALYYVAYLFTLLNITGRMLVMVENDDMEFYPGKNSDYYIKGLDYVTGENVIKYLADNDFIEAVFQVGENNSYILINKLKPKNKHKKVLFYYNEAMHASIYSNVKETFETFCWDMSKTKSNVGAYIASILEIQKNDYCLLPKEYIYDFDRITANAEFQVVSHLAHDLSPKLTKVDTVLEQLIHFIKSHGLLHEPLQELFYEGQALVPVGESINIARSNISQAHKLIADTRKQITTEIPIEEFRTVNLLGFLETIKKKYADRNFTLQIECDQAIQYEIHEARFAEMIDNFVRNAEAHGFTNTREKSQFIVLIKVTVESGNLIVELKNNGKPLPDELSVEEFIRFGRKGKNSPGEGLGGNSIYKVIRAHRGRFEFFRDDKEYPVNLKIILPIRENK